MRKTNVDVDVFFEDELEEGKMVESESGRDEYCPDQNHRPRVDRKIDGGTGGEGR
jgi:hypothetical protein